MARKKRFFNSILFLVFTIMTCTHCGVPFESSGDFYDKDNFTSNSKEDAELPVAGQSSFSSAKSLGANNSSPFRMLTSNELKNSLEDIFLINLPEIEADGYLPGFSENMFSNFQENINVSSVHVNGIRLIADLLDKKLTDDKIIDLVPCLESNTDVACKTQIINYLTLNIFRKKIDSQLHAKYLTFLNTHTNDLISGVRLFIQALVQSPSFLTRQEVGINKGRGYVLNNFEIASRMSYFITGSTPDATLLSLAEQNKLVDPAIRQEQALRLFSSARGKKNIYQINKEIFRISKIGVKKDLGELFNQESEMLFDDIIYKKDLPWTEVFTSQGSYMNRSLASHYGLSANSNDFTWTQYSGQRQGILSHGSFLSHLYSGDPEKTRPIRRGLQIVEDLLCKHLPPPSDVDIDNDPAARFDNECKITARKKTTLHPKSSCFNCHMFMEPLGLSLERFNMLGQYRAIEKDKPECSTIEPGVIDNQKFNSMQGLGQIMANHQDINLCLTKRVLSYAFGNFITNDEVMSYNTDLKLFKSNKTFKNLVVGIVSSPQFVRRDL